MRENEGNRNDATRFQCIYLLQLTLGNIKEEPNMFNFA
jgi:hypothetical protein